VLGSFLHAQKKLRISDVFFQNHPYDAIILGCGWFKFHSPGLKDNPEVAVPASVS